MFYLPKITKHYFRLGNKKLGLEWATKALELEPDDSGVLYNVACCYSLLGEIEDSIELLEKSVNSGFAKKDWLINDSDLDPLRDHTKFRSLIEEMN